MHTVRIDDAAPGYIVRKSVIIHIGPAIAATAGIARCVSTPPRSRTASSAWHVDRLRRCIDALFLSEAVAVLSAAYILQAGG